MPEVKRELKNLVINKKFQMRMTFYFMTLCLTLVGFMMILMNSHINDLRDVLANVSGLPISSQIAIEEGLTQLIITSLGFLLLSIAGATIYGIVISHRIAGPMYAILKYIDNLKIGKFDDNRNLRPGDELTPIMDALHELAKDLKAKQQK